VNLEGDIFDPNGTLSGGYLNPNESILLKNEEYKKINHQIEEFRKDQRVFEEKISKLKKDQEYLANLKTELESKTLKLNLLKEKIKKNSSARMQDKYLGLENDVVVFEDQVKQLLVIEKEHLKEIEELRIEKMGFLSNNAKDSKEIWKEKKKKLEGDLTKLNDEVGVLKKNIYKGEVEKEGVEGELKRLEGENVKWEKGYDDLKSNYAEKKTMLGLIKKEFEDLMEEKRKIEEKLVSVDSKLSSLFDEKVDLCLCIYVFMYWY
jgi:structural maintenance of chromosome 2